MNINKIINICGTARSGSTMVDLMLGNDPRAFSFGEVHAWFVHFEPTTTKLFVQCGKNNCPWEKLKTLKEHEFHHKCFELLDVNILVDSSKNMPWVIDSNIRARQNGIEVHNTLFKEPVSFYYSFWKRGVSIEHAKKQEFVKYYKRFFQSNIPFIAVNCNKLVADQATILERLCEVLGHPIL